MRRFSAALIAPVLAGLTFAACASVAAQSQADEPLYVRQVMKLKINPAMIGVWNVGNNAMDEEGGIDPALMDDATWTALNQSATKLAAAAREMASAQSVRAAHGDDSTVAEGEITMAKVQQLIDADPAGFRQAAADQATYAEKLAAAAAAKDAATAGPLVADMDGVCESCHARFWYGE